MLYDTSSSNTSPFLYSAQSQSSDRTTYFSSDNSINSSDASYFSSSSGQLEATQPQFLSINTQLVDGGSSPRGNNILGSIQGLGASPSSGTTKKRGSHLQFNANTSVPFCKSTLVSNVQSRLQSSSSMFKANQDPDLPLHIAFRLTPKLIEGSLLPKVNGRAIDETTFKSLWPFHVSTTKPVKKCARSR